MKSHKSLKSSLKEKALSGRAGSVMKQKEKEVNAKISKVDSILKNLKSVLDK